MDHFTKTATVSVQYFRRVRRGAQLGSTLWTNGGPTLGWCWIPMGIGHQTGVRQRIGCIGVDKQEIRAQLWTVCGELDACVIWASDNNWQETA
jgi:hypothetical protein